MFTMQLKEVLVIGAGKSSQELLAYLIAMCGQEKWRLRVVAKAFTKPFKKEMDLVKFVSCDALNDDRIDQWIKDANIVISMLPARFHMKIASKCLMFRKHFLTASYVGKDLNSMNDEAKDKDLIFLNECGLDPGLDHMSAMKIIQQIKSKGGVIRGFDSFTGGLVTPRFDDNPWRYKLTWNPRNVVLAGQGGVAKFKQHDTLKYIPYQQIFRRTERIHIPGYGNFEGYANRDSLTYESLYDLKDISSLFRGTLRREGFCKAWNKLIMLGMTDDSYVIDDLANMTYREFTNLFLSYHPTDSVELKFQRTLGINQDDFDVIEKMTYLGLFSPQKIGLKSATPAQVLQVLVEEKWRLKKGDTDMIVMWHKFTYELKGEQRELQSSLVVEGEKGGKTAMAKTVGLPLGIATKLILKGCVKSRGVIIPTSKDIYSPILKELDLDYGLSFKEKDISHKIKIV